MIRNAISDRHYLVLLLIYFIIFKKKNFFYKIMDKTQNEIEDISRKNLDLINRLSEVQK